MTTELKCSACGGLTEASAYCVHCGGILPEPGSSAYEKAVAAGAAWRAQLATSTEASGRIRPPELGRAAGPAAASTKSRGVFIILGLILGGMGAHNFYIGRYGRGFAQFAAGVVVAFCAMAGFFTVWIVALVMLLIWIILELIGDQHDALGRRLTL